MHRKNVPGDYQIWHGRTIATIRSSNRCLSQVVHQLYDPKYNTQRDNAFDTNFNACFLGNNLMEGADIPGKSY